MPAEAISIEEPRLQSFSLIAFDIGDDGAEDVEIITQTVKDPKIKKHASLAMLYGLAILTLDHDGTIERRIDELLTDGIINEVDAVNRIRILTEGLE